VSRRRIETKHGENSSMLQHFCIFLSGECSWQQPEMEADELEMVQVQGGWEVDGVLLPSVGAI
jgi:hypothetical protein